MDSYRAARYFLLWSYALFSFAALGGEGRPVVAMPADLKAAFDDARYKLQATKSGGLRADNAANGFSVEFSGAATTIDVGNGARTTLTLTGYGWGSELHPAGRVTGI